MNAKSNSTSLKDVRVLVVDDEDILAWSIDTELKALGAEVQRAGSIREALERFTSFSPDIAITDLRLPDGNGLELLKKWRLEYPEMPVILITAHGAVDSAITALRLGAFDYLQKPFDLKDLMAAAKRASEIAQLRQKVSSMTGREVSQDDVQIVGGSPVMAQLRQQLQRLAKSKANTALILGESGTGKELAARAIHQWGERRGQAFVEINCASIPETLLESELFGFEKGAFTDARERKLGLFEIARGGTIFLDELGEMPLKLQSKLLRVLEYRRFKRLGGTKDIEFTGRIVAATNRNLLAEVQAGRFRGDLYYRLSALPVQLPLLSERIQDIPELTGHFLEALGHELGMGTPTVAPEALAKLMSYPWPGNVRELKNVLQRAMVFFEPKVLGPEHLLLDPLPARALASMATAAAPTADGHLLGAEVRPSEYGARAPELAPVAHGDGEAAQAAAAWTASGARLDVPPTAFSGTYPQVATTSSAAEAPGEFRLPAQGVNLEDLERSLLLQALERARNNQTRAAQLLGITRHTLRYRLEKYGLNQENSN